MQQKLFTGPGGSDQTEWEAWLSKDACSVLSPADSAEIRSTKPDLIVPTRCARTNKNDGLVGQNFKAKSRLVVQGFKDKALGAFRRDPHSKCHCRKYLSMPSCILPVHTSCKGH